jgi:hypothetical protein
MSQYNKMATNSDSEFLIELEESDYDASEDETHPSKMPRLSMEPKENNETLVQSP